MIDTVTSAASEVFCAKSRQLACRVFRCSLRSCLFPSFPALRLAFNFEIPLPCLPLFCAVLSLPREQAQILPQGHVKCCVFIILIFFFLHFRCCVCASLCWFNFFQVRIKPKIRMLGEAPVHADGVWKLQNDSTKEMTAQVRLFIPVLLASAALRCHVQCHATYEYVVFLERRYLVV